MDLVHPQFVSYGFGNGRARAATKPVGNGLRLQATRLCERADGPMTLSQFRLDVLTVEGRR